MVDTVEEYIDRIERSVAPQDVMNNVYLSELSFDWLLVQYGFFKQVAYEITESRWKALQQFVEASRCHFSVDDPILGCFHSEYGATGRFLLDRKIGRTSSRGHFFVLVNGLDAPVYWPLAIHEIAHCWLSSQDHVVEISSGFETSLEPGIQEGRVEEALCDAVATVVMGPSYAFSYINRLWTSFIIPNSPEYPKDSFRLELMARILEESGYLVEAQDIQSMRNELGCEDWQEESIVDSLEVIEESALGLPLVTSTPLSESDTPDMGGFIDDPSRDLRKLFHVGWGLLNQSSVDTFSESLESVSKTILIALERNRATFNT